MKEKRNYSLLDQICLGFDQVLRALNNTTHSTNATYPAQDVVEPLLSDDERNVSASLMRVNHAGEICAQALYHGQAMAAGSPSVRNKMRQAALEEGDHLNWCTRRLDELGSHTSYLNPFWYAGSFCIGLVAGMIGEKWNLGFVAETETQVIKHLQKHLKRLPNNDLRSQAILVQMEKDEGKHRQDAISFGAKALPGVIKGTMSLMSKVMVKTAYWV